MTNLNDLKQQKAELISKSKAILGSAENEQRSITDAESKQVDELRSQVEAINAHIKQAEFVADEERSMIGDAPSKDPAAPSNDELRSFVQTGEQRSLSAGAVADGGYTVIPSVDKEIMRILRERSVFRQNATVKSIGTQTYKKLVSIGGAGATWASESDARAETNTAQLREVSISLNSIYSYPTTTQELLDWSDFDVAGWLASEVSEETLLAEETAFWTGDGNKKPNGILAATRHNNTPSTSATNNDATRTVGQVHEVVTAGLQALTTSEIVMFLTAMKPEYRANSKFYMSDAMANTLRRLQDSNGNFIWVESFNTELSSTMLGKPVVITDQVPDDEIVLADLARAYHVIDHSSGTKMIRDNITAPGFVKMYASRYVGGGIVDSNAVKILKLAA